MAVPPNKKKNEQTVDEYLESIGVQKAEPTTTTKPTTPTTTTTPSWSTVTEMAQNSATTPSWADPNANTTTTTTPPTTSTVPPANKPNNQTIVSGNTGENEPNAAPTPTTSTTPPVYRPNNQTIISGNTGENEPNAAPETEEEKKDDNGGEDSLGATDQNTSTPNQTITSGNTGNTENTKPTITEDQLKELLNSVGATNDTGITEDILNDYSANVESGLNTGNAFLDAILNAASGATIANTNNAAILEALDFANKYLDRSDAQAAAINDAIANTQMAGSDWDDKLLESYQSVLGQNMAKSDVYSQNIYGNTDYMNNLGTELMNYIKGYNPLETDWGKGVLDYYGLQSGYASNTANSEGAANNAGNVDSYAAANAERQRLDTLGQGINALSGLTNSRFENLLNAYNSTGSNITSLLGLEGQYNLPFATNQLNSVKELAKGIYDRDAQSVDEYNTAIKNLLGLGNDNVNNINTALSTIAGLGASINDDQVNAQNDLNDFVQGLYEIGGQNVLPYLESIINGQGTVGNNLYNTDANSTVALYELMSNLFGNTTDAITGDEEPSVIMPTTDTVNAVIDSVVNSGRFDGSSLTAENIANAIIDMDETGSLKNYYEYIYQLANQYLNKTE